MRTQAGDCARERRWETVVRRKKELFVCRASSDEERKPREPCQPMGTVCQTRSLGATAMPALLPEFLRGQTLSCHLGS